MSQGSNKSGQGDIFERAPMPFEFGGLDISVPPNFLPSQRYPYIKNIRAYNDGRISTRPGLLSIAEGLISPHTIIRLNDPTSILDYVYILGDSTELKTGKVSFTTRDTGFNGRRLTHIIHRPERSPKPLCYLTEGSKMRKVSVEGTTNQWGIFPPTAPPTVVVSAPPNQVSITDCTSANPQVVAENGNVWNKSVNASTLTQVNRTNTTISTILYDSGSTGYCNIIPAVMGTDIQPGQRIFVASAEYVLVEQTFPAIATTTIAGIAYHSGSTGLATIQLSTPTAGLATNTLVNLNNGVTNEWVRVLSVTDGPDGLPCFRAVTVATYAATNTVTGAKNFRTYTAATRIATDTLVTKAYESFIDFGFNDPSIPGIGNVRHNISLDLSNAGSRPITDSDVLVFGFYIDDITKLVEGRVWIDLDPNTTTTYNALDLSRNYYFYPFRKEDLQAFADKSSESTQLSASFTNIQSNQIDVFNSRGAVQTARDPVTGQAVSLDQLAQFRQQLAGQSGGVTSTAKRKLLQRYDELLGNTGQGGGLLTAPVKPTGEFQAQSGREQWYTVTVKIGDLIRIGTDQSLTLKNSTSFMVNVNVSADATIRFSSAFIGGTYGPDTDTSSDLLGNAYYYRYLARNSRTGETGLASPPTRAGVIPNRQQTLLTIPFYSVNELPTAQVDKLDIYRYGGTLLQWTYIGTVTNTDPSTTFVDNLPDEFITNNPVLRFDNFPPFPTADLPRTGVCNVVGTRLTRTSGDTLNLNYSPGTEVVINGKTFLTYAQPETTNIVELTESAGNLSGVTFELPNPIIIGQPLPTVFGPYGQGSSGLTYFGLGDTKNPGLLYYTNGNDANSASDLNYIEITSPSEPLIGGCIYDGRPFVFSSEKMFYVNENGDPNNPQRFIAQEIANSKGAWCRTGICVDTLIYFIGKDGIYEAQGGQPTCITNEALFSLFPHEGRPGDGLSTNGGGIPTSIATIGVPDFESPEDMLLMGDGQYIHFIYRTVSGTPTWAMLLWDIVGKRWMYDVYGDGGVLSMYSDRGKEIYGNKFGTVNGAFAEFSTANGNMDVADGIVTQVVTHCFDAKDSRARKRFGDLMLDFASNTAAGSGDAGTVVEVWVDNFATRIFGPTELFAPIRQRQVLDLDLGATEQFGVNIALNITQIACDPGPLDLFEWQPAFIIVPEDVQLRATDWESPNQLGAFELQGLLIEADTEGQSRTISVESADGGVIEVLTINHPVQVVKAYSLTTPTIGSSFRLRPTDSTDTWKLFNVKWIGNSAPELVTTWETQYTTHDVNGWLHVREAYIALLSTATVTLTVTVDSTAYVYTIPSTGGVRARIYLPLQAVKGKQVKYRLTSPSGFRLYERDSNLSVGQWGRGESEYMQVQPFGGTHRESGARI